MSNRKPRQFSRRQALGVIGAAGAAMVACNSSSPTSPGRDHDDPHSDDTSAHN